jgi:hypothetical protein
MSKWFGPKAASAAVIIARERFGREFVPYARRRRRPEH